MKRVLITLLIIVASIGIGYFAYHYFGGGSCGATGCSQDSTQQGVKHLGQLFEQPKTIENLDLIIAGIQNLPPTLTQEEAKTLEEMFVDYRSEVAEIVLKEYRDNCREYGRLAQFNEEEKKFLNKYGYVIESAEGEEWFFISPLFLTNLFKAYKSEIEIAQVEFNNHMDQFYVLHDGCLTVTYDELCDIIHMYEEFLAKYPELVVMYSDTLEELRYALFNGGTASPYKPNYDKIAAAIKKHIKLHPNSPSNKEMKEKLKEWGKL